MLIVQISDTHLVRRNARYHPEEADSLACLTGGFFELEPPMVQLHRRSDDRLANYAVPPERFRSGARDEEASSDETPSGRDERG